MAREVDPRLQELYDKNIPVYSISRIDTINRCLAEAYETYILHNHGKDNVYGALGTVIHETLEDIVNNKATEADLLPAMKKELEDIDMLGMTFPKVGDDPDIVKRGWVDNMTHFCETYQSPKSDRLSTEELFIYKTRNGHYLQGYIDLQRLNPDGSISIYDYKTSAMYSGEALKEHGRQLVVYALGLMQMGKNVKSVSWIFLKYVDITFMGKKTVKSKNKTELKKTIERRKIAKEMSKYVRDDMYELGYDEADVDMYLDKFRDANKFESLPEDVSCLYKMSPCVYNYELTDEIIEECEQYLDDSIDRWEALGNDVDNFPPLDFTTTTKSGIVKRNDFYCSQLCSHGDTCIYHRDFVDQWQQEEEVADDLF